MRSVLLPLLLLATSTASIPFAANAITPNPFDDPSAVAVVLLFTRTDCPISNRYAPEIRRIFDRYSNRHVRFFLVYPDRDEKSESIATHQKEYGYPMPAIRDPDHTLVTKSRARITPEAAVFLPPAQSPAKGLKGEWRLVYHGRIDDRYVDFGKSRPAPQVHDLDDALAAAVAGRLPAQAETKAIGCYISDLK